MNAYSFRFTSVILILLAMMVTAFGQSPMQQRRNRLLKPEPGTIDVEDLLQKPIKLKVVRETPVYSRSTMETALGYMAPGTLVSLVGIGEKAYRVRGRARHGDVSGWIRMEDLLAPDPQLIPNLKKLHERQMQVEELIAKRQIALGMTVDEVMAALGKPNRKSSKLTAAGRDETYEYVVYDNVPQYTTGLDAFGRVVQNVIYVKVESGKMSVIFKDGVVESVEETKGNPLGGGIKIVPAPFFFGY